MTIIYLFQYVICLFISIFAPVFPQRVMRSHTNELLSGHCMDTDLMTAFSCIESFSMSMIEYMLNIMLYHKVSQILKIIVFKLIEYYYRCE